MLTENDPAVAAQKLAGMDAGLLITAFSQHVRVYDPAVLKLQTEDGDEIDAIHIPEGASTCEVGGYLVVATRDDAWDAIVDVLVALEAAHSDVFHRVMRGCRSLSNDAPEVDGLDDLASEPEQAMFDQTVEREERRDKQGYMSPAQARAFLQAARELDIRSTTMPEPSAVTRAYFSAVDPAAAADEPGGGAHAPAHRMRRPWPMRRTDSIVELLDALRDAGVVPQAPRALLDQPAGESVRLARIRAAMQAARERDELAYLRRGEELAYLANTLMAGSSIQGRPMTAQEASDAAVAVCNLGLERWPSHWNAQPSRGRRAVASAVSTGDGYRTTSWSRRISFASSRSDGRFCIARSACTQQSACATCWPASSLMIATS